MTRKEFNANKKYLLEDCKNIFFNGGSLKETTELETYTDAGEDMIIYLEVLDKEHLQEYIDNFDINDEVLVWWQHGKEYAHSKGVPFDNIKEHYEDYEAWLEWLKGICNNMPY